MPGAGGGRGNLGDRSKERFNVSALLGTLTISLAVAVLLLLGFVLWRERRSSALTRAAGQLEGIVRSGNFAERVRVGGAASDFAETADRDERGVIASRSSCRRARPSDVTNTRTRGYHIVAAATA